MFSYGATLALQTLEKELQGMHRQTLQLERSQIRRQPDLLDFG